MNMMSMTLVQISADEEGETTCKGGLIGRHPDAIVSKGNRYSLSSVGTLVNMYTENYQKAVEKFCTDRRVAVLTFHRHCLVVDHRIPKEYFNNRLRHIDQLYLPDFVLEFAKAYLGPVE